jgi:hypothetical protein
MKTKMYTIGTKRNFQNWSNICEGFVPEKDLGWAVFNKGEAVAYLEYVREQLIVKEIEVEVTPVPLVLTRGSGR